jgi:hypothetical protein
MSSHSFHLALDELSATLALVLDPAELPGPLPVPTSAQEVADLFRLCSEALRRQAEKAEEAASDHERKVEELEEVIESLQQSARDSA